LFACEQHPENQFRKTANEAKMFLFVFAENEETTPAAWSIFCSNVQL
jgi:hypothetical protein